MDKKMYKYIGILVGLVVLLVVVVWISNLVSGGTTYSYESIEKKLVSATKSYMKDHSAMLPTEVGESVTISPTVLVNNNYFKGFESYVKDSDVVCNGSVDVYMAGDGYYDYTPTLNCGNKHNTTKLYEKVLEDNNYGIVMGYGLYQRVDGKFITNEDDLVIDNNYESLEYVFRGKDVNNYVKIDDNYWRIVAISDAGDMTLLFSGTLQRGVSWDDKYNESVGKNQGINDYEKNGIKSTIREEVEKFYNGEATLLNKEEYSPKTKYLISPASLCIGKRKATDKDSSGKIECSQRLDGQYVGLLPAYYYMSASVDENCDTITSRSCGNDNYLSSFNDYWWLLTANQEASNEAYQVFKTYARSELCIAKTNVKPTVLLGNRVLWESGDGSSNNPYTIKFYADESLN